MVIVMIASVIDGSASTVPVTVMSCRPSAVVMMLSPVIGAKSMLMAVFEGLSLSKIRSVPCASTKTALTGSVRLMSANSGLPSTIKSSTIGMLM